MQQFNLALSRDNICNNIYALSALRSFTTPEDSPFPAILTPDNRKALILVINDAFSNITMRLLSIVSNIDFDNNEDIMMLTIEVCDRVAPSSANTLRALLESSITHYVLHLCYDVANTSKSNNYLDRVDADISSIHAILAVTPPTNTIARFPR
ncbi:MAG: hypothetical protein IJZ17_04810 [Muribaculaceae bacterium]|nr:hypothetical protein [Muribaculaceae bacterium]